MLLHCDIWCCVMWRRRSGHFCVVFVNLLSALDCDNNTNLMWMLHHIYHWTVSQHMAITRLYLLLTSLYCLWQNQHGVERLFSAWVCVFFMLYQAFTCLFWPESGAGPSAEACISYVADGAVHRLLVDQLQRDPLRSSVSSTKISLWCLLLQELGRSFNPSSVQSVPNSLFSPGLFIAVPFRAIQPSRQANWIFPKFPQQTGLSPLSCCQSAIICCVMEHEAEAHLI